MKIEEALRELPVGPQAKRLFQEYVAGRDQEDAERARGSRDRRPRVVQPKVVLGVDPRRDGHRSGQRTDSVRRRRLPGPVSGPRLGFGCGDAYNAGRLELPKSRHASREYDDTFFRG